MARLPRAIVIEDEAPMRRIMTQALGSRGIMVRAASDGLEALRAFTEGRADTDLICADIRMPNMDGREFARRLRQQGVDIPIIFVSGTLEKSQEGYREKSHLYLIAKPFSPGKLADVAQEMLARPKPRPQRAGRGEAPAQATAPAPPPPPPPAAPAPAPALTETRELQSLAEPSEEVLEDEARVFSRGTIVLIVVLAAAAAVAWYALDLREERIRILHERDEAIGQRDAARAANAELAKRLSAAERERDEAREALKRATAEDDQADR